MHRKRKSISAKKYLMILTSAFLVPLALFLLLYSGISLESFQRVDAELAQTGYRTIEMYRLLLEQELTNQCTSVANNWTRDPSHQVMRYSADTIEVYYAINVIKEQYRSMMSNSFCLRGMTLYSSVNHVQNTWLKEGEYSFELTQKVHKEMCNIAQNADEFLQKGFFPRAIDGHHFLFRIIGYQEACTVLMIDMDTLAKFQNQDIPHDNGFLYYATTAGEPFCEGNEMANDFDYTLTDGKDDYCITRTKPNYLVVGTPSNLIHLKILYFVPYSRSITIMKTLYFILPFLSLALLMMTSLLYRLLKHPLVEPIGKLSTEIAEIRRGNLDERINEEFTIREFSEVGVTFNQMISEIQDLKITAYENELKKNHAQMQYMQLQLRPHFFLNCLKTLYSMAQQEKYDRMQPMILHLSTYLRSKFLDIDTCISLQEELKFVENYVSLQKESLLRDVQYSAQVEKSVEKCCVPVLLIQTFIENSFKYGCRQGTPLVLSVRALRLPSDEGDFLDIILQDNGEGFDLGTLERVNALTDETSPYSENVGIANVKQRLNVMFGERAMLQISNLECGAQIEIILPAEEMEL